MKARIKLIEKGDKLYVYTPKSMKKEVREYFKGFTGALKVKGKKMSGTEFIRQMYKEANMDLDQRKRYIIKKR
ncbi:MAG TPA: hypothetical protein VJJ23_01465 [Candidatus Nanoarchaeia archaeon]|nr:hypothetical protein [Candidatus Nanoarchaeia archaeon]